MTNKKAEELNEAELDQITGGTSEIEFVEVAGGSKYQDGDDLLAKGEGSGRPGTKGIQKTGGGSSI